MTNGAARSPPLRTRGAGLHPPSSAEGAASRRLRTPPAAPREARRALPAASSLLQRLVLSPTPGGGRSVGRFWFSLYFPAGETRPEGEGFGGTRAARTAEWAPRRRPRPRPGGGRAPRIPGQPCGEAARSPIFSRSGSRGHLTCAPEAPPAAGPPTRRREGSRRSPASGAGARSPQRAPAAMKVWSSEHVFG